MSDREKERNSDPDPVDGQMMWVLWRHIRLVDERFSLNTNNDIILHIHYSYAIVKACREEEERDGC